MKTTKTFDCVVLKNRIQAQILEERKGLSDQEVRKIVAKRLETSSSPIGRLWRTLTEKTSTDPVEP